MSFRSVATGVLVAATTATVTSPPAAATSTAWHGAWGAAVQPATATMEWYGENWSLDGFADDSLRQVIRVGDGGSLVRIRLSNVYGTSPLRVSGATIARAGADAGVRPGSVRALRFGGRTATVVPPGRELVSDAVALRTSPLERLTVTLRVTATGPATFHHFAMATTYRAAGDHLADVGGAAFTRSSASWYYLAGVETAGSPHHGTVVAFGDSLTDGVGSTRDADARYPDRLAERFVAAGRPVGVVNAGIGGNRVLTDSPLWGERAVSRFRRDVLGRPGVRGVLVLAGVNDLAAWNETGPVTSAQVIEGHRTLIRLARGHGITVVGATIMPMAGSGAYSEDGERVRQEVNHWIRTSGEYDAVADFDHAVAAGDRLSAAYDSGDHVHLNDAGYRAVANAVDLAVF